MKYFIFSSLAVVLLFSDAKAQLHYKVKKPTQSSICAITGTCTSSCCDNFNNSLAVGMLLYIEETTCDETIFKTLSNIQKSCITINRDDIGFFFGKVRPRYFYIEPTASVDGNSNNSSVSVMANLFITHYRPLKRFDKDHWLIGGIRTGVSYGVVIADTDPMLNGQSLLKYFKTELVIGRYNRINETVISFALGYSPLNYRDGVRVDQRYPHASVNFSYLLDTNKKRKTDARNISQQDKERK